MKDAIMNNMASRFSAYSEIVAGLNDASLQSRLEIPKNKSLAEHLWCVIGARESYARAIEADEWSGFACSLENYSQADFTLKLAESASGVLSAVGGVEQWTPGRTELLLALYEHEVMHEGQLIRHMYGLGYDIPESVKWA